MASTPPPLSQGVGYGVVVGLGALFAIVSQSLPALFQFWRQFLLSRLSTDPYSPLMCFLFPAHLGRCGYFTLARPLRWYFERC